MRIDSLIRNREINKPEPLEIVFVNCESHVKHPELFDHILEERRPSRGEGLSLEFYKPIPKDPDYKCPYDCCNPK